MEKSILNTISRAERLKSKKRIGEVFSAGQSIKAYPLRFVWLEKSVSNPLDPIIQFSVSVPKKRFKNAVDRNRLKRVIRESYRLSKADHLSSMPEGRSFFLMILYMAPDKLSFQKIDKALAKGFQKWINQLNQKPTADKS